MTDQTAVIIENEVEQEKEFIRKALIEQTKSLRAEYKNLEQVLEAMQTGTGRGKAGRYVALALTATESARHWLGEVLGALDVESSYKA